MINKLILPLLFVTLFAQDGNIDITLTDSRASATS